MAPPPPPFSLSHTHLLSPHSDSGAGVTAAVLGAGLIAFRQVRNGGGVGKEKGRRQRGGAIPLSTSPLALISLPPPSSPPFSSPLPLPGQHESLPGHDAGPRGRPGRHRRPNAGVDGGVRVGGAGRERGGARRGVRRCGAHFFFCLYVLVSALESECVPVRGVFVWWWWAWACKQGRQCVFCGLFGGGVGGKENKRGARRQVRGAESERLLFSLR